MGIKFFDFDNDGRMDLFVTDMHSDMFRPMDPHEEKNKASTNRPESFLMGPPAISSSVTLCITTRAAAGSKKSPDPRVSKTTGRGVRAPETSMRTAGRICLSRLP